MSWTDDDERKLQELKSARQEMLHAQYGDLPPVDRKGYVDLFHPFFRRLENERGFPTGLISGMAEHESSGNALIRARDPKSSAAGLFQITKKTAKDWGLTPEQRFDPVRSAIAAADILAKRARKYGIERAVGMHYGGQGTPWEQVVGSSGESPSSYAAQIFELAQRYANP